jgi:hypothetical protein
LAADWVRLPTVVETDCAELVRALANANTGWTRWVGLISEIRRQASYYWHGRSYMLEEMQTRWHMSWQNLL